MPFEAEALKPVFPSVWQRRRLVFAVTALVLVAGIVYTLLVPAVWEAKATIIFPVRTPSPLGMGNFEQQSLATAALGGPTPIKVYGGMLESERVLGYVADKVGLKRKAVRDMRSVIDQATQSTITVSARNRDAELARRVVALHLEALTKVNVDLNKPMVAVDSDALRKQVRAQAGRVQEVERRLLQAQSKAVTAPSVAPSGTGKEATVVTGPSRWSSTLRELELEETKLTSAIGAAESQISKVSSQGGRLPSQVEPVEKWRTKLTELEYDLRVQELTFGPDADEIKKLKKTIAITRQQLGNELNRYVSASRAGMVGAQNNLPELLAERVGLQAQIAAVKQLAKLAPSETMELTRLTRQLATESGILQQLQAQYRLAEVQEVRDPNRWEVLDMPEVDELPINKSLLKNGGLSLLLGVVFGIVAALIWPARPRDSEDHPDLVEA